MRKLFVTGFVLCLSFIAIDPACADEEKRTQESRSETLANEWADDRVALNKISSDDPDRCDKQFNILWNAAKRGNLEARSVLLVMMTMIHGPFLNLPGNSWDYLTRLRAIYIMAVHSIGHNLDPNANEYVDNWWKDLKQLGPKTKFGKCMQEHRSQECVKIAVEEDTIPSFEEFAAEIDLWIEAGYRPRCMPQRREPLTIDKDPADK